MPKRACQPGQSSRAPRHSAELTRDATHRLVTNPPRSRLETTQMAARTVIEHGTPSTQGTNSVESPTTKGDSPAAAKTGLAW